MADSKGSAYLISSLIRQESKKLKVEIWCFITVSSIEVWALGLKERVDVGIDG